MGTATPFRARFGIQSRVVTYADSATITPNANTSDVCVMTALSQGLTIANPIVTNPYDGQLLQIRIASSVSRALSFGAGIQAVSALCFPPATTGGGAEDYIALRYNSLDVKWDLISTTIGAAPSTATLILDTITAVQGSVLFRGASIWQGLAPSTAGFALVTGGAGTGLAYAQIPVIVNKAIQFTPSALETGVVPVLQINTVDSAFTLANSLTAQNCFTSGRSTITLSTSTSYLVEGFYKIVAGAVTHTTAIGFAGTVNITNFEYEAMLWNAAANTITTTQSTTQVSGVASKVLNATSVSVHTLIKFKGILRVNVGGTIIPQITFSADPTGACTMAIGSYISFTALGLNSLQSVGNWS